MELLNSATAFINDHMIASSGVIGVLLEVILHAIPSQKPLGILHTISAVVHGLSGIFSAFGALLDKIIPQNLDK